MLRIICIAILLVILCGCASRANLEWNLNSWVGQDVDGLVQHWGKPSDIGALSNGNVSYSWMFDQGLTNAHINGVVSGYAKFCKITLAVSSNDRLVQSWQLEGNNCKA